MPGVSGYGITRLGMEAAFYRKGMDKAEWRRRILYLDYGVSNTTGRQLRMLFYRMLFKALPFFSPNYSPNLRQLSYSSL